MGVQRYQHYVIIVFIAIILIIYSFCVLFRCGATSCTRWWVAEASMGDFMRLITEKLSTETLASWANMTSFQCFSINLRGFYEFHQLS
jgi:hypothetical protein